MNGKGLVTLGAILASIGVLVAIIASGVGERGCSAIFGFMALAGLVIFVIGRLKVQ